MRLWFIELPRHNARAALSRFGARSAFIPRANRLCLLTLNNQLSTNDSSSFIKHEPRRLQMGERSFQFLEFLRGTVHFYSDQVRDFERFRQQHADVLEMREHAVGSDITFTAKNFVAIDAEAIEKIVLLGRRFLLKGRERGFERLEFSWMHFKVRVKTDEICRDAHAPTVDRACERVECSRGCDI
jgi:hypothetical protein